MPDVIYAPQQKMPTLQLLQDNTLPSFASLSPSPESRYQLLPRDSSAFQKANRANPAGESVEEASLRPPLAGHALLQP